MNAPVMDEFFSDFNNRIKLQRLLDNEKFPRKVDKVWGGEHILELNKNYCFKRIEIKKGHKTSLQYHQFKRETNFLASGEAMYYWRDAKGYTHKKEVSAGFFVTLQPGEVHRFEALTDLVLFEASSPEIWDVERIDDDYGREGTSEP